jgi:hypothetical protein
MIQAQVHQKDQLIMDRTYYEPTLTLEKVMSQLEHYLVSEHINVAGECLIRVRFSNLSVA